MKERGLSASEQEEDEVPSKEMTARVFANRKKTERESPHRPGKGSSQQTAASKTILRPLDASSESTTESRQGSNGEVHSGIKKLKGQEKGKKHSSKKVLQRKHRGVTTCARKRPAIRAENKTRHAKGNIGRKTRDIETRTSSGSVPKSQHSRHVNSREGDERSRIRATHEPPPSRTKESKVPHKGKDELRREKRENSPRCFAKHVAERWEEKCVQTIVAQYDHTGRIAKNAPERKNTERKGGETLIPFVKKKRMPRNH